MRSILSTNESYPRYGFNNAVDSEQNIWESSYSAEIEVQVSEKSNLLVNFSQMRNESSFCDVTFNCNGSLLKAHRVVVSAWSRWLRSLLLDIAEESSQVNLSMDMFPPKEFTIVLDYMYGVPFTIDFGVSNLILINNSINFTF